MGICWDRGLDSDLDKGFSQCHESVINNLQPGRNNLVITSTTWRLPYSKIWKIGEFFEEKMTFKDEEHLEFSKLIQDKVSNTHFKKR